MEPATANAIALSRPPLDKVGADIHILLLEHCCFESLAMLRGTSKFWKGHAEAFINMLWNHELLPFFANVVAFRDMLDDTHSIVSGSLILSLILHATSFRQWQPSDMDVYCPIHAVQRVVDYLCRREGYDIIDAGHDRQSLPLSDYHGGIAVVVKLFHSTRRSHIDLVCSSRAASDFPLTYFWGTLVMNWFSGHSFCISYPLWTLRGLGCVRPTTTFDRRINACALKYASRQFYLTSFADAPWAATRHGERTPYCAHHPRSFRDKACMKMIISRKGYTQRRPSSVPFWTFGGRACPICGTTAEGFVILAHT